MSKIMEEYSTNLNNLFNYLTKTAEESGFYSPNRQKVCLDVEDDQSFIKLEKAVKFLERRFHEQGMEEHLQAELFQKVSQDSLWKKRWNKNTMVLANGEEVESVGELN